ncbi:MAG: argininosuccinate lyase [Herpetosiphonaceae bacterium]|nr:MAG: argininosuccinate lyase [Herpetosiphonaceae bacterium]
MSKMSQAGSTDHSLTGRIASGPSDVLIDEVLRPQFDYELANLLPDYLLIEQALLAEYVRLEVLTADDARRIAGLLAAITPELLMAKAALSMTDIAFAIETMVMQQLQPDVPRWHVDRSRNDLQACAQLMGGRRQLLMVADGLRALIKTAIDLAGRTTHIPMPGYTHYQAAQVITPGFYFSAFAGQMLRSLEQLLAIYRVINECPLGAGALSGQDLPWDRERLALLLGFERAQPHALPSVASREWALRISAELAILGTTLSRFVTDLLLWGSSGYGFIDLPDQLAGISSAMPQKKNFPVLERIRGRTAHMSALFVDLAMGQRSTPFTNLVEVSKEAGANLMLQLMSARSTLRLLSLVLEHLRFREDRLRAACEEEFFGGFRLANTLTLEYGLPYRRAQVLAGRYIMAAMERDLKPMDVDPSLLAEICAAEGYAVDMDSSTLQHIFAVETNVIEKQSAGSTSPPAVEELLKSQREQLRALEQHLQERWSRLQAVPEGIRTTLELAQ